MGASGRGSPQRPGPGHTVLTQPRGGTAGQKEGEAGRRATRSTEVPATGIAQKCGAFAHCFLPRCAGLVDVLHNKPIILEEVERDVLFCGRDPGSVGNRTAVSPPLTGAIMSPGSKRPFPSFLPVGQAPTSGTRRTPNSL